MRADVVLRESGHAAMRWQAQRLIASGVHWRPWPLSPWQPVAKNGAGIPPGAHLHLLGAAEARYLSRAGLKLEAALGALGLCVAARRCLDVGQSTGGFTDCLLQRGAAPVGGGGVGGLDKCAWGGGRGGGGWGRRAGSRPRSRRSRGPGLPASI